MSFWIQRTPCLIGWSESIDKCILIWLIRKREKDWHLPEKRALHWSIQQQTIATLKSTSKQQSTTTPITRTQTQRDPYLNSPQTIFHTPQELPAHSTETIQAIQQTLLDLQEQKEAIDIPISVLQHRLDFLLKTKRARWMTWTQALKRRPSPFIRSTPSWPRLSNLSFHYQVVLLNYNFQSSIKAQLKTSCIYYINLIRQKGS